MNHACCSEVLGARVEKCMQSGESEAGILHPCSRTHLHQNLYGDGGVAAFVNQLKLLSGQC